jgi:group I intron endonuclease
MIGFKMYTVYKHTTPNGKVYIGITKQKVKKRWFNGEGYRGCSYFYKAIQKYGWENIKHEILFTGLTKEEAETKEIELIEYYDSTNSEKGYNLREGGSLYGFNDETIRKMRESHIGKTLPNEQKEKISIALKGRKTSRGMLGHKHSEETKIKMSLANKGKKKSPEATEKMRKSLTGKLVGSKNGHSHAVVNITTGERFECITMAAKNIM